MAKNLTRKKEEEMIENLQNYIVPSVLIICLCVGYGWKHITWLDKLSNDYIPLAMLTIGAILVCVMNGTVTIEHVSAGMLTGLAAVGLHQAFVRTIDGLSKKEE